MLMVMALMISWLAHRIILMVEVVEHYMSFLIFLTQSQPPLQVERAVVFEYKEQYQLPVVLPPLRTFSIVSIVMTQQLPGHHALLMTVHIHLDQKHLNVV
jgi:hypothetical protein